MNCDRCNSALLSETGHYKVTAEGDYICESCCDNYYGVSDHDGQLYPNHDLVYDDVTREMVTHEQLDDRYFICEHCNERTHIENISDDTDICNDCYDETTECYCCGERVNQSNTYIVRNSRNDEQDYCTDCTNNQTRRCESCDERYDDDALYWRNDSCYCSDCVDDVDEEEDENENFINDYSFKPTPKFRKKYDFEENEYLGVELEVEIEQSIAQKQFLFRNDLLYCKKDGSLNKGFEIVTHPMTLKYHKKLFGWRDILTNLISNDGKSHQTDTCGLHIHVSKTLSNLNQWKLVYFMYKCQDMLKIFSRRKIYRYCEFKMPSSYASSSNVSGKRNYPYISPRCDDRYTAVNFNNSKTIEFRFFRGTLKESTFFAALEFSKVSIDFVKHHGISFFLLSDSNLLWKTFYEYVLQENKYQTLIKYIKSKNINPLIK